MPGRRRPLDPDASLPLSVQLAAVLADEVARGVYQAGDKIPGARMLAERWSVSDKTAQEAIAVLVSNGVLRKGVRTRPAVVEATPAQARKAKAELEKFGARSDTERIDDLEARIRRAEEARGTGEGAAELAQLREAIDEVRKYAETVEARVLAIELREKDQAEAAAERH